MISGEWLALAAIALAVGFFIGAVGVGGILLMGLLGRSYFGRTRSEGRYQAIK